jgi:hypothetical protein
MSGALSFLSWAKRGIGTRISDPSAPDGPTTETARARVSVELTLNSGTAGPPTPGLGLVGPAEIVGFDTRAVIRTWPAPDATDAEPNYFPLLEFDQADLPWRYTPAKADTDADRLRPWCCLIALRAADEVAQFLPPTGERPFGVVRIPDGTPMPHPDQAWAWAHVQASGATTADAELLKDRFANAPEQVIARLLCPRHLDANTNYWGMLIPVFEQARLAGMRQPLGEVTNALERAWSLKTDATLDGGVDGWREFPVYYRWRFRTGTGGDFESLIRLLRPRELPATVGLRDMDVSDPGGGVDDPATTPIGAQGALKTPETGSPPWLPTDDPFVESIAPVLNKPADARETTTTEPVVAPPLYGQWHAQRRRLNQTPLVSWFQTLNSDPRTRVAAGLGTTVVQGQQQQLMASAWDQVGRVRLINDLLRKAQLGRALSERLFERYLSPLDADALLFFTQATHGRVLRSTDPGAKTVRSLARQSPSREVLMTGAYRRLARPLGALGRRQSRPNATPQPVISRVNDQTYMPAPPQPAPTAQTLPTHGWLMGLYGANWPGPPTAATIDAAPKRPDDIAWDPELGTEPQPDPGTPGQDSPSMSAFRTAASAFAARSANQPLTGETLRRLDPPALKARLMTALNPKVTVPASLKTRIVRATGFTWDPPDPIEPVMAAPEFVQPMYKPLAELSQDWLLPGIKDVPANTVSLAVTNQAFIEAYMVGLNHEMARELLWNEYPTDQRGTYFRQFWDPSGFAPAGGAWPPDPATKEILRDIKPIHQWTAASNLGSNSPRSAETTEQLVLLVRGEVLRRYPRTLIYLARADVDGTGKLILKNPEEQRSPVFGGILTPDLCFFGFNLTPEAARGLGGSDHGWFVVFQEQAAEPRFGLDEESPPPPIPTSWNDLAWDRLDAGATYIDLDATLPNVSGFEEPAGVNWHVVDGATAADLAYITYQAPVRVLVHATEMLPES